MDRSQIASSLVHWGGRAPSWLLTAASLLILSSLSAQPSWSQISAQQARESIERGVAYLRKQQRPERGDWPDLENYPGGITALCTLALLNAGVPADDPTMARALQAIRRNKRERMTYCVALDTMVLCLAEPEKDRLQIRDNVSWLQRNQIPEGMNAGGWSYSEKRAESKNTFGGDPSNSQFALLALYEAERIGVEVPDIVWRRALGYWTRLQHEDGSWAYPSDNRPTGSMTCAGIASTIIALGQVTEGDAAIMGQTVDCCRPQQDLSIPARGVDWLARHFSVMTNPAIGDPRQKAGSQLSWLYYLYAVERVGRMTGSRFLGDHDWYREGAELLIKKQDRIAGYWKGFGSVEENPLIATSFALLFLSKGRRPVVVGKLQYDDTPAWNHHRRDLAHLTSHIEQRWQRDLTWQVVDGRSAQLEDLLQSPVLFLNGSDALTFDDKFKQKLKAYVEQGGFLFASGSCGSEAFDRDFRALMEELFPDSPMRLLPPDHAIWYADDKVPAEFLQPLWGVDTCCRTSIVYCPSDLSCYWELATPRRPRDIPENIAREIEARLTIGSNVLTYATNRELKEKLDAPRVVLTASDQGETQRGTLYVAKLQHGGGSDDAPAAVSNLLQFAQEQIKQRVSSEKRLVSLTSETLFDYPIVYVHGRRDFRWTDEERRGLRTFIERGGVVMADAICASEPFAVALRREILAALPDARWQPVPPTHPLLTNAFQGYDLTTVEVRDPRPQSSDGTRAAARIESTSPTLEAIEIDGRLVVIFSPLDMSCALENQTSIACKGYVRADAIKLGINALLYAMQQ